MKPEPFYLDAMVPGLDLLTDLTGTPSDERARVLVMAIAGQESEWEHRRQIGGPARSYWQFEQWGAVNGVLSHPASSDRARKVCAALDIPSDVPTVYEAMAWNDRLAVTMARLLLWTDPAPLPGIGSQQAAWDYYLRTWRPGKPHPETWPERYATAMDVVARL